MQPDILSPPLLRLTSRKPLWLDLQPVDIKSRWRHNWKSAQVVNSHLVCDPRIRQPGFDLTRQQWSLLNRFRTEQGHCGVCRRKCRLTDTDLCPWPRRCLTLLNPVPWQNWMAVYIGYILRMKTLFRGWPVIAHVMHTRRRRLRNKPQPRRGLSRHHIFTMLSAWQQLCAHSGASYGQTMGQTDRVSDLGVLRHHI